jgi:SMI1-KNR4 cell-wall
MRVPGLEEVLRRLPDIKGARLGRGVEEAELADTERRLGVTLPPGYRSFLKQIGWATIARVAVFGLGDDVPADLDLRTRAAEAAPDLPANMVPFARDDDGVVYCLDAAHSGPYESPVYRWGSGTSAEAAPEYAGHDFASWLWMRLAEMPS